MANTTTNTPETFQAQIDAEYAIQRMVWLQRPERQAVRRKIEEMRDVARQEIVFVRRLRANRERGQARNRRGTTRLETATKAMIGSLARYRAWQRVLREDPRVLEDGWYDACAEEGAGL